MQSLFPALGKRIVSDILVSSCSRWNSSWQPHPEVVGGVRQKKKSKRSPRLGEGSDGLLREVSRKRGELSLFGMRYLR